jgi:hypothetical protein
MTFLALSRPSFWKRFEVLLEILVPSQDCTTPRDASREDSRARRDFILEMLDRNPDAFQSELDVQNMARLYRCKF